MKQPRPLVAVGAAVFYFSPDASHGAAAPVEALVVRVHSQHLVDLEWEGDAGWRCEPLVPFLCDGEPDPKSPRGFCQPERLRAMPVPVVINPGTEHAFRVDPATGAPL